MTYYILDIWLVNPGYEDEFIAYWTDLVRWTIQEIPGIASGVPLYRDIQQLNRFFCPIAWESAEAIAAWRASQGYQSRLEQIERLCAELEARTLVLATKLSPSAIA
jgi:heme-degrading monooxygenase HmoA